MDKQSLAALETCRQQMTAAANKDLPTLRKLIDPAASLIHLTGETQDRETWLKQINSGQLRYFDVTEEDHHVEINRDHAQVDLKNQVNARVYGMQRTWPLHSITDLIMQHGHWVIIRSQVHLY